MGEGKEKTIGNDEAGGGFLRNPLLYLQESVFVLSSRRFEACYWEHKMGAGFRRKPASY
jgi:hypothetical protein